MSQVTSNTFSRYQSIASRHLIPETGDNSIALSVVVPCYNEREGVNEFHRRMISAISQQQCTSELIYVNDGSTDDTLNKLTSLTWGSGDIIVLDLSRNHGHQIAVSAGMSIARGSRVLIIDSDLQDPPELLIQMMSAMDQGASVVYGKRRTRKGETFFKLVTASIFYRILNTMAGVNIPRDTGDFRLMAREVIDVFNSMPEPHRFLRGMVSWIGFKQVALEYDREPRFAGSTKYPLHKMIALAIDAVTGFATAPLRIFFYLAFASLAGAISMLFWTFYSYFSLNAVEGWSSLASITLLLSSLQLFGLALIAEYVGRAFIQGKQRPLFLIKSMHHKHPDRIILHEVVVK